MSGAHPTCLPVREVPHVIGVHGSHTVSDSIDQHYSDTCVVRCQQLVLRQYGVNVSQEQLIEESRQHGWYSPGQGVQGEFTGDLLATHGVPAAKYLHANVFNLTAELAQGHKVIIGVDSGDLWGTKPIHQWFENALGIRSPDHAVIVSGIDTTDPSDVKVIITDPGTGDAAKAYPLAAFLSAWKDSDFFMVATKTPAPLEFNPEMARFDYRLGHVPTLGKLTFEQFVHGFQPCTDPDLSHSIVRTQAEELVRAMRHGADDAHDVESHGWSHLGERPGGETHESDLHEHQELDDARRPETHDADAHASRHFHPGVHMERDSHDHLQSSGHSAHEPEHDREINDPHHTDDHECLDLNPWPGHSDVDTHH